jgi:hypothetical protein
MQLRRLGVTLAVVLSAAVISAVPSQSLAADTPTPVEATPKGKIGMGLLGAEIGVAVPAIIGLDQWWAYVIFPVAGAAGGALLGHFWLDQGDHAELSVVFLTAGMTLVIPTLVLAAAATAYDPDEEAESQASLGTGAVRYDAGSFKLAAPGVSVLPDAQAGRLHVSGVHVSLMSGRF